MSNKIIVLKDIQRLLSSIGAYKGQIDGLIGHGTYQAILDLYDKKYSGKQASDVKNTAREIQKLLVAEKVYFGEIDGAFGPASRSAFNALMPAPSITDYQIRRIYPTAVLGFADHINKHAAAFQLRTKAELCAFLANVLHESNGFKLLRENMNYSAERLIAVFPKYFRSLAYAKQVVNAGQIRIADVVYGGRMGNGKDNGDGFAYRGGGMIHLTGKDNYRLCSIGINEPNLLTDPAIITQPDIAVRSALWFWRRNNIGRHANQGDFTQVCKVINGGTNGLEERKSLHVKAWNNIF